MRSLVGRLPQRVLLLSMCHVCARVCTRSGTPGIHTAHVCGAIKSTPRAQTTWHKPAEFNSNAGNTHDSANPAVRTHSTHIELEESPNINEMRKFQERERCMFLVAIAVCMLVIILVVSTCSLSSATMHTITGSAQLCVHGPVIEGLGFSQTPQNEEE